MLAITACKQSSGGNRQEEIKPWITPGDDVCSRNPSRLGTPWGRGRLAPIAPGGSVPEPAPRRSGGRAIDALGRSHRGGLPVPRRRDRTTRGPPHPRHAPHPDRHRQPKRLTVSPPGPVWSCPTDSPKPQPVAAVTGMHLDATETPSVSGAGNGGQRVRFPTASPARSLRSSHHRFTDAVTCGVGS